MQFCNRALRFGGVFLCLFFLTVARQQVQRHTGCSYAAKPAAPANAPKHWHLGHVSFINSGDVAAMLSSPGLAHLMLSCPVGQYALPLPQVAPWRQLPSFQGRQVVFRRGPSKRKAAGRKEPFSGRTPRPLPTPAAGSPKFALSCQARPAFYYHLLTSAGYGTNYNSEGRQAGTGRGAGPAWGGLPRAKPAAASLRNRARTTGLLQSSPQARHGHACLLSKGVPEPSFCNIPRFVWVFLWKVPSLSGTRWPQCI